MNIKFQFPVMTNSNTNSKCRYNLPPLASFSPSFFEFLFNFKGAVGAPTPDAPEEDTPPFRSEEVEFDGGGLSPDVMFIVFCWAS